MPILKLEVSTDSLFLSRSMANWNVKGTVRTTRHGDIRWTTFSVFHGEERWRSEGVQVGGINSGRGVLGKFNS